MKLGPFDSYSFSAYFPDPQVPQIPTAELTPRVFGIVGPVSNRKWVSATGMSQRASSGRCGYLLRDTHEMSNGRWRCLFYFYFSKTDSWGFGCMESTRGNHTSRMGRVSNYLVTGNVRKPTGICFRCSALLARLRFFLIVSRNPGFFLSFLL